MFLLTFFQSIHTFKKMFVLLLKAAGFLHSFQHILKIKMKHISSSSNRDCLKGRNYNHIFQP